MTARYSIHIPGVSFEEEAEITFSVKDVLLEEISKGDVSHLEGSESNTAYSVKEGKLDPPMTLMLTPFDAITCATIHLLNFFQTEPQKERIFLMSLR